MITEAFLARRAEVWHIHTPTALLPFARDARFDLSANDVHAELARLEALQARWSAVRDRLHLVPLREGTVPEYREVLHETVRSQRIHVAVLAMAVSDFEPTRFPGKMETPTAELVIPCHPTPKVIREVRSWAPDIYLVGFKLLSGASERDLIETAEASCVTNDADLVVANDFQTLLANRHTIHLVRPGQQVETYSGESIARSLVDRTCTWAEAKAGIRRAGEA
jgi:phosphopantothenate-cysteine ligase